jgi:hypothetical protein
MFVADENCIQFFRVYTAETHTLDDFSATESGIQHNTSAAGGDNGAIPFGAGAKYCDTNHMKRVPRFMVEASAN